MAAYKPTKTLLLHERLRKKGPTLPLLQGGWDDTAKVFVPIENYSAYKNLLAAEGFVRPGCEIFMDAFTSGVEAGELTSENWFGVFENLRDWHTLADDLTDGAPRWINERARQALRHVLQDVDMLPAMLTSLEALGNGLVNAIDWAAINREIADQPPAKLQKDGNPGPMSFRVEVDKPYFALPGGLVGLRGATATAFSMRSRAGGARRSEPLTASKKPLCSRA